jgi:cytochrome c5
MTNRLISWIVDDGSALLPLALVAVLSCDETPRVETDRDLPSQATVRDQLLLASAKVALPPPGVAPTDLPDPESEGAGLVQQYCTACHELPTPLIHSATDWPRVVRRMWLRMDGVGGSYDVAIPASAERVVMLRYLIDNALKVSGATRSKSAGSPCHPDQSDSFSQQPAVAATSFPTQSSMPTKTGSLSYSVWRR